MKKKVMHWWHDWADGMANLVPRFGVTMPAPLPTNDEAWLADQAAVASDWAVVNQDLCEAAQMWHQTRWRG